MVGIVSESDLVLSDEESDLHLPHYLNIMGGVVFVGSMKGFEERLEQGLRDQRPRPDDAPTRSSPAATTRRRRSPGRSPSTHHNHLPVVDGDGRLAGMVTRADALAALVGE